MSALDRNRPWSREEIRGSILVSKVLQESIFIDYQLQCHIIEEIKKAHIKTVSLNLEKIL